MRVYKYNIISIYNEYIMHIIHCKANKIKRVVCKM